MILLTEKGCFVKGAWYLSLPPIASEDVKAPADERCSVIGSG